MEVKDFMTTYPDYGPDFEGEIFRLKEFNKEKLPPDAINPDGGLYKHQKVLARFLSESTPYNSLLVIHQVGTGKTCAAFAIAEANQRIMKKTIFLSPSQDLNKQQRKELIEKCFPDKYRDLADRLRAGGRVGSSQLPYYRFTTPQTLGNTISRMSEKAIREKYSNTLFIIDEVHKIKPYENVKDKKIQLAKKKKELVEMMQDKDSKRSDIDKLKEEVKSLQKQTVQAYIQLQKVFRIAENIKILLLTATPMIDKASEIVGILNLILPGNQQLKKTDWQSTDKLKKAIKGRVSFLKSPEIATPKEFVGECYIDDKEEKDIPSGISTALDRVNIDLVSCVMSEVQTKTYLQSWCEAIFKPEDLKTWKEQTPTLCHTINPPKRQKSLAYGAEQASLLILGANGTVPDMQSKTIYGSKIKRPDLVKFINSIKRGRNSLEIAKALYPFAPKYSLTIQKLLEAYATGKKTFIYMRSVSGGGANALKYILENIGYKDVTFRKRQVLAQGKIKTKKVALKKLPTSERKRFVFLTGDTNVDKASVIDIFNSPENAEGKYIQLLIGTDTITQGFSIKDVQEMHVHDPPWNYPTLEQAMGRIIRRGSHVIINKILQDRDEELIVKIYLYNALPELTKGVGKTFMKEQKALDNDSDALSYWNSIDLKKYTKMTSKDFEIKSVEKILKENAFDCGLFYQRNVRKHAKDGSRECEYADCNYTCDGISMDEIMGRVPVDLMDTNYDLLYSEEELEELRTVLIEEYLPENHVLTLLEIFNLFNQNHSLPIILKALNYIIQRPGIIKDRFGMPLFLKERNNVYYVTYESDSAFKDELILPILTQPNDSGYVHRVSNSLTKRILCDIQAEIMRLQPSIDDKNIELVGLVKNILSNGVESTKLVEWLYESPPEEIKGTLLSSMSPGDLTMLISQENNEPVKQMKIRRERILKNMGVNTTIKNIFTDYTRTEIAKEEILTEVKNRIVKLLNTETPVIKELIVENSVVALEHDNALKLANIILKTKTVEGSLLFKNGNIISNIIPGCTRKLDLASPKSETFCGKKVPWSPPSWQDNLGTTKNYIDDEIKNLLRRALNSKYTFLGVGSGDNLVILKIDVLYPQVGTKRDVNGPPSVENLKRKKDKKTIDLRAVPSGRKAVSYPHKDKKEFFDELGIKMPKKSREMVKILEKAMKDKEIWIPKTSINLDDKKKKDVIINLYKEVLT